MRWFVLTFFHFFICFSPAYSQTDSTVVIHGTIQDQVDEPLIGATVKVMRDQAFIKGTISDVEGKYSLRLEPGRYDLEFQYAGFVTVKIIGVSLSARQFESLDVKMDNNVIPDRDEFMCFGPPPLIDFDPGNTGATFFSYEIRCRY